MEAHVRCQGSRLKSGESPTLYRTDRQSWVVQGWVVTDPDALGAMDIPEGETCVEIPDRLVPFFGQAR